METLSFDIIINATKEKIWNILWSPETYSEWTKFFSENVTSTMKTDWEVGGKTYFLGDSGNGMVSTIKSMDKPNEITFAHLGMLINGVEDTKSKEVEEWSGAPERYFLIELDNGTIKLQVEVSTSSEWADHMKNGFTKGLEIVKNLSEM